MAGKSLYEATDDSTTYRAVLECPVGHVPPPTLTVHVPGVGPLTYTYAGPA